MQRNTEAAQASPLVFVCTDCGREHDHEIALVFCCNQAALNRSNHRWTDAPARASRWADDE
jgi:hypothetical protein